MVEIPRNTLPSAEELRAVVAPWWPEGGLAQLIVSVLRRTRANVEEAQQVAERLAESAENGLRFITDSRVEETWEMVVAARTVRKHREKSHGKDPDALDPDKCVFSDVFDCPQCTRFMRVGDPGVEPMKHGRLLSEEELGLRIAETHAYLRELFHETDPSWVPPKEKRHER
jgi:hypothetical protein